MCTSLQLGGLRGQQERLVNSPSIHDFTCSLVCSEHLLAAAQQAAGWAGREERERESQTRSSFQMQLFVWDSGWEQKKSRQEEEEEEGWLLSSSGVSSSGPGLCSKDIAASGWASFSVLVTACPARPALAARRPCLVCTFLPSSISIPSACAQVNSSAAHLQEASSLRFFPSEGIWEGFSSPVKEQPREKQHHDVMPH